jgi:tetratricopeptide (TPR) repeat protein
VTGGEVTNGAPAAPHTLRSIQEMLGLSRKVILNLVAAGFVVPVRGARNEYRFSFQDVVLLRTAHQLRQAQIGPRKLLRSLRLLRSRLPQELPMSGLRIRAVGADVTVKDGNAQWEAQTGQMLLDLEVTGAGGNAVAFLQHAALQNETPAASTAAQWYDRALSLETADPRAAEAAYRRALDLQPGYADAYANLGALMCEQRRWLEAVTLFDEGVARCPNVALLHFNRGIALEESHRADEALQSYLKCLRLEPGFADAHYNVARLLELKGQQQGALQHYSAYRRLQRGK